MKRIKLALALALALLLTMTAAAAGAEALDVQDVRMAEGGVLSALLYGPANRGVGTYSATLDGQELAVNSLNANEDGTTWMFLVDTSTVSINNGTEPIRALLGLGDNNGLIDLLGPNDNASLIATGDISEKYDLVTRPQNLESQAGQMKENTSNTTLNATLASALNFMNTNDGVKRHKVIVVISSGETDNEAGMSSRELQDLISLSDVTIYTVAFVRDKADWNAIAKFGALTDNSCGGLKFTPAATAKANDAAKIVSDIKANEQLFMDLRINPNGASGTQLTVAVNDGNLHLEDTVPLSEDVAGGLISLPSEPEPEPTEEPKPFPFNLPVAALAGIAAGLVVIIALVIVLVVRSSKKKKQAEEERRAEEERMSREAEKSRTKISETVPDEPIPSRPAVPPQMPPTPAEPEIQVTLSQIGSEDEACYIGDMQNGTLVVGRDPAFSRLVVQKDPKISHKHMTLRFENGVMMVEDCSRNGTKVNDVRINQPTVLHQQDVLTIGLTRLRITWWVKR